MKKGSANELHQDGLEHSKKLYRSISDSARRLDDAHRCAQSVCDLFAPSLQIQRSRLQEFCQRLIFLEPLLYGRKGEELLWRKTYHDVISASKKLKNKDYTPEELSNIQTHINSGVGHYHHFISKLQNRFDINDLANFVDFAAYRNGFRRSGDLGGKAELVEWARLSIHRCLIYLGDLCRYKLEIYPNSDSSLAVRYYLNAIYFKPEFGVPYNQMGTLASNQNHMLDAVYYYMCCLACQHPFEGTENNLTRLFEKNTYLTDSITIIKPNSTTDQKQPEPADHIKRLISRFLYLADAWFFNKNVTDIYLICHQINTDLLECLSKSNASENDGDSIDNDSPTLLTSETVFKIVIICLLCVSKLQKTQSNQISTAVAFTLAVYSQLIQIVTEHIQDSLLILEVPDLVIVKKKRSRKNKTKRRRKKTSSGEDSDCSEIVVPSEVDSNSDPSSEDELIFSSSDSDDEVTKQSNNNNSLNNSKSSDELVQKARSVDCNIVLDIISEEKLLNSVRILSDWFVSDSEIAKSCGKSTKSLLKQIVNLVNLLNVDFNSEEPARIALPEDATLKGIEIVAALTKITDWDFIRNKTLSTKDETAIRSKQLVEFGHSLSKIEETGISYDGVKRVFVMQEAGPDNSEESAGDTSILDAENAIASIFDSKSPECNEKGQLAKMKHMGQLWLAAEVRALENRFKSKTSLSPYLVVDVDTLIQCTPIVKHLVNSKKFIVIVPSAVVSALDDLKREKLEARDAIRWLELQFHYGNRFCRAQRPQERSSIPFIKYPKKKDKETSAYIQIIECCHYFAQQQKDASNIVTMLMGNANLLNNTDSKEVSYTGLARSAGITLEFAAEFYDKWRRNSKGKK